MFSFLNKNSLGLVSEADGTTTESIVISAPKPVPAHREKHTCTTDASFSLNGPVFKVPLESLLTSQAALFPGTSATWSQKDVPLIVQSIVETLIAKPTTFEKEGLFRLAGTRSRVDEIISKIDAEGQLFTSFDITQEARDVLGDILKNFVRNIPDTLLQTSLVSHWSILSVLLSQESKKSIPIFNTKITEVFDMLPTAHFSLVKYIFAFLWCLDQTKDYTKMTARNLSIVWAPNLLLDQDGIPLILITNVVEHMISNYEAVFHIDPRFLFDIPTLGVDKTYFDKLMKRGPPPELTAKPQFTTNKGNADDKGVVQDLQVEVLRTESEVRRAEVVCRYQKTSDSELSIEVGEILVILNDEEGGWVLGENKSHQIGYFPGDYVKRMLDEEQHQEDLPPVAANGLATVLKSEEVERFKVLLKEKDAKIQELIHQLQEEKKKREEEREESKKRIEAGRVQKGDELVRTLLKSIGVDDKWINLLIEQEVKMLGLVSMSISDLEMLGVKKGVAIQIFNACKQVSKGV